MSECFAITLSAVFVCIILMMIVTLNFIVLKIVDKIRGFIIDCYDHYEILHEEGISG